MKTTVSQHDFTEAFRAIRPDNFTHDGLVALFAYFELLEADIGEDIELDVIAICCEFYEYENLAEFQDNYGSDDYPDIESIQDNTMVIQIGPYLSAMDEPHRPFIIQSF